MTSHHAPSARLVYVIGASGAGKDSLLRYARARIGDAPVAFAHRYITRPADPGGENHVPLSPEAFQRLLECGGFALHWQGNGLRYGIGIEVERWLASGLSVVVNGSRAHLDTAASRFPDLQPVLIEASPERLAERLRARGRENAEQILSRVERARCHSQLSHPQLRIIRNDGPLEEAGEALLRVLHDAIPAARRRA